MNNTSTTKAYVVGFVLSVVLTLIAYTLITSHIVSGVVAIACILVLALMQLLVQLFFFLHLGQESKPRWNLLFFISTFVVVVMIVVASLWIMNNLNYNMTPGEMGNYLINDEGFHK